MSVKPGVPYPIGSNQFPAVQPVVNMPLSQNATSWTPPKHSIPSTPTPIIPVGRGK